MEILGTGIFIAAGIFVFVWKERCVTDSLRRALRKGIDEFLSIPRKKSKLYSRIIDYDDDIAKAITTSSLEDTHIDVDIFDIAGINHK